MLRLVHPVLYTEQRAHRGGPQPQDTAAEAPQTLAGCRKLYTFWWGSAFPYSVSFALSEFSPQVGPSMDRVYVGQRIDQVMSGRAPLQAKISQDSQKSSKHHASQPLAFAYAIPAPETPFLPLPDTCLSFSHKLSQVSFSPGNTNTVRSTQEIFNKCQLLLSIFVFLL